MGTYETGMGQLLTNVHEPKDCAGPHCPIHNPTEHHMASWPTYYAEHRMFRVCEHNAAHPDPDQPQPPSDMLILREAVASVSLSHPAGCGCDTCLAGRGDDEAFARIVESIGACGCKCRCCDGDVKVSLVH